MDSLASASLVVGAALTLVTIVGIIRLVSYALRIAAGWKVFTKAGEKGWKSLIPIYNQIVQYKLTWKPAMIVPILAMAAASGLLMQMDSPILVTIGAILYLAAAVLEIIGLHKLSRAFGHGGGFTLGLVLVEGIFWLILGFGKSEYIGNTSERG